MKLEVLDIRRVREDGGTQARATLNLDAVASYAEAMRNKEKFRPIVVFFDGTDYWLADGFHRVAAAVDAQLQELEAEVHEGTRRDAVLYAVGANAGHGVHRSQADKRTAVRLLLTDAEWSAWSDRKIAQACRVSHPFVADLRRERDGVGTKPLRRGSATRGAWSSGGAPVSEAGRTADVLPLGERKNFDDSSTNVVPLPRPDDELAEAARLESRIAALVADVRAATPRVRRLIDPALDDLRRLARMA